MKCLIQNANTAIQPRVDIFGKWKALIALYNVHKIIINAMNISAIYISICGLIIDGIDAVAAGAE